VPDQVFLDALRLQQVVSNALTNASKHTTRGEIAVSVWLDCCKPLQIVVESGGGAAGILAASLPAMEQPRLDLRGIPARAWFGRKLPKMSAWTAHPTPADVPPRTSSKSEALFPSLCGSGHSEEATVPPPIVEGEEPWMLHWLVVDVADTGAGLGGRDGAALFEPFIQGEGINTPVPTPAASQAAPAPTPTASPSPAPSNLPPAAGAAGILHRANLTSITAAPLLGSPSAPAPTPAGGQESSSILGRSVASNRTGGSGGAAAAARNDAFSSVRDAIKGSGLGLSLSANLISLMGGHIALAEAKGRTHLVIRIPVYMRHPPPAAQPARSIMQSMGAARAMELGLGAAMGMGGMGMGNNTPTAKLGSNANAYMVGQGNSGGARGRTESRPGPLIVPSSATRGEQNPTNRDIVSGSIQIQVCFNLW
jgi:hypothetical protein